MGGSAAQPGFRVGTCGQLPQAAVIAEIKKASPSQGDRRISIPVANPPRAMWAGGQLPLSVLQRQDFSRRAECCGGAAVVSLPLALKDFIPPPYQLLSGHGLPR